MQDYSKKAICDLGKDVWQYGGLVTSSDSKDLSEQKKNVDFKKKANILIERR